MTFVEQILRALRIDYKIKGRRAWALCSWHDDHSPSWYILISGKRRAQDGRLYNAAGQNWCFSCQNGGTLTDLVMRVRGMSKEDAEWYIENANERYKVPEVKAYVVSRPPVLGRRRFRMPPEYLTAPLTRWISSAKNFAAERCITPEEVDMFQIGYAVDDRLAGRVILPWLGRDARPAGYSARTFVDDEPKYLTPHTNENADWSTMFGEHLWPSQHDTLTVTEGAINALAVRRAFPDMPIAALGGSEIYPGQVIKIATFKRVLILTDPDAAGDKAARSLASTLGRHNESFRLRLPDKKDAFDVGPEYLRRAITQALTSFSSSHPDALH